MALPDIPTRSPLRGEVPTLDDIAELLDLIEDLQQRVTALENPGEGVFPGATLYPGLTLYPKAG